MLMIDYKNLYGFKSMRDLLQVIYDAKISGMSDDEILSMLKRNAEGSKE